MAKFLVGGAAAQLEARDKDRALHKYMFDQRLAREQQDRDYNRTMDYRRWNYGFQDNQRKYDLEQQRIAMQQKNLDRNYELKKRDSDFNYERRKTADERASAERWAAGLNSDEFADAVNAAYGRESKLNLNDYQREAVKLRQAGADQATLAYERDLKKIESRNARSSQSGRGGGNRAQAPLEYKGPLEYARDTVSQISQGFAVPPEYEVGGEDHQDFTSRIAQAALARAKKKQISLEKAILEIMEELNYKQRSNSASESN